MLNHECFILERLQALKRVEAGITQIRCHGDYHHGQVLCVENNFVILDFEGEPARSLAERRRKFSPLKDVAGMLRSLSYAAYAALFAFLENRPADFPQLKRWAQFWQQWTSVSFMQSYLATVAGATFLPHESQHLATLLEGFLLDKVLYELNYELNNHPDWLRIPLQGITQLSSTVSAHPQVSLAGLSAGSHSRPSFAPENAKRAGDLGLGKAFWARAH